MMLATDVATRSKDPSTHVGAIIVGPDNEIRATGYNGFPRGIQDSDARLVDRQSRLDFTVHAEPNAIFNAVRIGTSTRGCTLYVAGLPPCHECAKAMIQAGIIRVVYKSDDVPERWASSVALGALLLTEAGVRRSKLVCQPSQ
jgi:dCMP deaminase